MQAGEIKVEYAGRLCDVKGMESGEIVEALEIGQLPRVAANAPSKKVAVISMPSGERLVVAANSWSFIYLLPADG